MIKLIVADFDGTLVPYGEETVSPRVRAQIEADNAMKAQEAKPKKINYGGLPGTKPNKKRK